MPRYPKDTNRFVLRITQSLRKDGKPRYQLTPPKRLMDRIAERGDAITGTFRITDSELELTMENDLDD
ncbi:MAG: hypothetical protein ACXADD_18600 [Candidatus Thorarchaeota archaeon]|jgi:hypothetical protein